MSEVPEHLRFSVPNMDAVMTEDDAMDLEALSKVLQTLHGYAETKSKAMKFRIAGCVTKAISLEQICEGLYRRLPAWARW